MNTAETLRHKLRAYNEVLAAKRGRPASVRSQLLKLIMPELSGSLGKKFEKAFLGRDAEAFKQVWQAAGAKIAKEIDAMKKNEARETKETTKKAENEAPKRGPGRPPKVASKQEETPLKRGPGRPRKVVEEKPQVKRGPGRPRKVVAPQETPVKRGPGRPPKVAEKPSAKAPAKLKTGPLKIRKSFGDFDD